MPGDKEPFAGGMNVRQSATVETHRAIVRSREGNSLALSFVRGICG
jgi:hypothetical protein